MRVLWPEPVATEIVAAFRNTLETGEAYPIAKFLERARRHRQRRVVRMGAAPHHVARRAARGRVATPSTRRGCAKPSTDLREADRRKDEFLATLAHELRNPLAPIRNGLQILRVTHGADAASYGRVHEMLERQVNHLVRLVDDLMEVARVTRGSIELRKEPVDLGARAAQRRRDEPSADRGGASRARR